MSLRQNTTIYSIM